jgi:ATP-dependent protease HslVU (ClpYQ) peptidase subunit
MSLAAGKRYQNTTVRLPRQVYEQAKTVAVQSQASSFNEFVVQAIEEKVRRLTEAEIDAAFAHMANDADYQHSSIALASEFEKSDWEALQSGTTHDRPRHEQPQPKTRASKTRSR